MTPASDSETAVADIGDRILLQPDGRPVRLTVVVPTRDLAGRVAALLRTLGRAIAPLPAEIVLADDSDDDTPAAVARCAAFCPVPVRLVHRPRGKRRGGSAGAVVEAARHARGDWVLVMNGDLRHPPAAAAAIARTALSHDVDVVVGTRNHAAGRARLSATGTRVVRTAFPRRLATVTDPLSGLFAFRAAAVDLDRLNPVGFRILLEILVRHPATRVAEVSYEPTGDPRPSGRQQAQFLRHLLRLRAARLVGQMRQGPATRQERISQLGRMLAFGLVGLSGMVVNTAALWLFYNVLGIHHLLGAALATQASTTWNFALIEALVYGRTGNGTWRGRAARFVILNNLLLLLRLPAMQALIWSGVGVLTANAVTLVVLFLLRFLISDRVIYGRTQTAGRDPVRVLVHLEPAPASGSRRKRSHYLTYRYDVAGTVTIGSQVLLPELEFFRAQWVPDDDVDIAVRVGDVGPRRPRRRAAMTEYPGPATMRYEEHLGRLGANFRIDLGDPVTVVVGPLLARSPHVVYTNIVEALLRFVLITRDRMLLHSACLSLDGVGVMLSALTDTGKTATVLRLLREHGGRFLSDDMTVVDATGTAVCFPKPLTISAHTLRAVRADDLTPGEWRRLRVQSRLHSRGGRSFALTLSRFNLPIMGINAITQMLVPPPKYSVDRLVPCRIGSATRVAELFVIERGSPRVTDLDHAAAVERMLANTDDAYGFPPFRYLAPAVTIAGRHYQELRDREQQILAAFLSHVRCRVLASDTFGWADEIPRLLAAAPVGVTAGDPVDAWPHWGGRIAAR
jgi:putative flippase GtrA